MRSSEKRHGHYSKHCVITCNCGEIFYTITQWEEHLEKHGKFFEYARSWREYEARKIWGSHK